MPTCLKLIGCSLVATGVTIREFGCRGVHLPSIHFHNILINFFLLECHSLALANVYMANSDT